MLNKKITIAIISQNSRHNLPDCLTSVLDQNYPKDLVKIVVLDNNSSDSSIGYVREKFPRIKIIPNNRTVGGAVIGNQVYFLAEKNNSDYLVLIDAATILEHNWLKRMASLLDSDKKIGIAGSKILVHHEKDVVHSLGGEINLVGFCHYNHSGKKDKFSNSTFWDVDFVPSDACAIKISALKKVGEFDAQFSNLGECNLGWRIRLAGYKAVIDPLTIAYYRPSGSNDPAEHFHSEKNRSMMLLQNYHAITLIMLFPLLIFVEVGQIIDSIARKCFKQKLKSCFWILFHLPSIINKRVHVQFDMRKVGDLEILRFKK